MTSDEPMTGTEDRPIERIPTGPSTAIDWLVMLGGPAIWINHFMVVYLAAEAACVPTSSDQYQVLGADSLVLVTVVATVVAAAACAALARAARTRCRRRDASGTAGYVVDMASAGFLLALGSLIGVIAVGIPAVYLSPLC